MNKNELKDAVAANLERGKVKLICGGDNGKYCSEYYFSDVGDNKILIKYESPASKEYSFVVLSDEAFADLEYEILKAFMEDTPLVNEMHRFFDESAAVEL